MASSDPLDAFFKKIDRKGNKHKKQAALLTNTEELHKQLVIVTSATSAFKENMDLDEEDEAYANQPVVPSADAANPFEDGLKAAVHSVSAGPSANTKSKLSVQDSNNNTYKEQQMAGDEWEEFDNSSAKYEELRSKLSRAANDEEIYSDDENRLNEDQVDGSANRRREQQPQDKPAWKVEQLQGAAAAVATDELAADKVLEKPSGEPVKPASTGAYRPPQLRGNTAVTVVSGASQRAGKKEKPNLASTEEFPTLGAGLSKK